MCECKRLAMVWGKTSDRCVFEYAGEESDGYVPSNVGIGGGDDIHLDYCLDCGKIQSKDFPVSEEALMEVFEN